MGMPKEMSGPKSAHAVRKDYAIPIVFPDYLIAVAVAKSRVDLIPGVSWDNFELPGFNTKMPELGHAGVMLINGGTGLTRYYEYGRYDPRALGLTRSLKIDDVRIAKDDIDWASLKIPLRQISRAAGHGGRIEAALIVTDGKFPEMEKYAKLRITENRNPKRKPYSITSHSCVHFAKSVVEAGGVGTPWMVDPRPNSYIGEFQSSFPDVKYDPKANKLTVEGKGEF